MLSYDDALNMNFYKKGEYTGWMKPIRFLIKMEKTEEGESFFHGWVWPEPLIFSLADENTKIDHTAAFTEEGRKEMVDWVNEQLELFKKALT